MSNKDLTELQRIARDQDWLVERTPGSHFKWSPPDGSAPVITSSTPSDQNIIKTIKSDLSKAGLILDKGEARRLKKKIKLGLVDGVTPDGRVGFDTKTLPSFMRPNSPLVEWTDEQIFQAVEHMNQTQPTEYADRISALTSRQRKAYAEMMRRAGDYSDDGTVATYWPKTCETCGYAPDKGDVTLDLYVHLLSNRDHNPTPPEGMESIVKRDQINPPARERLNCPFCAEWFWISQPVGLATHAATDHAKAECPYCNKYFSTIKGGLGKHMRTCPAGGEQALAAAKVTPNIEPETIKPPLLAVTGTAKRPDNWNPDPCAGGCNRAVGDNPGKSYCVGCQKVLDEIEQEERTAALLAESTPAPSPPLVPGGVIPTRRRRPLTAPSAASGPVNPPAAERTADMTDDELFTLLEMVMDGPVTLDRATFATVNRWMDVTRELLAIKYGQEG